MNRITTKSYPSRRIQLVLPLRAVERVDEPVPWWHRASRSRRVGLPILIDAFHTISGIPAALFETADWIEQISPASSVTEKAPVAHSEQRLHSILATIEECRAHLIESASQEAAQLLSVAILELRMKLNRIADSELKALCDAMLRDDAPAERPHDPKSPHGQRRRPLLKLVK